MRNGREGAAGMRRPSWATPGRILLAGTLLMLFGCDETHTHSGPVTSTSPAPGRRLVAAWPPSSKPGAMTAQGQEPENAVWVYQGRYKLGSPYKIKGKWYYPGVDYQYNEVGIASWYGPKFHGRQTANGDRFDMNALTAAHKSLPMPSMVEVTNLENGLVAHLLVNDRGPFVADRIIDVSRAAADVLKFRRQGTTRVRVRVLEDDSRTLALQAKRQNAERHPMPKITAAPVAAVAVDRLPASNREVASEKSASSSRSSALGSGPVRVPEPGASSGRFSPSGADGVKTPPTARQPGFFVQVGAFLSKGNAQRLEQRLTAYGPVVVQPIESGGRLFHAVRLGPLASRETATDLVDRLEEDGLPGARVLR